MGYQQIRQVFTGCLFGFDYQDLRLAGTVGVTVLGGFCGFPFAFFDGEQTLQAANPANELARPPATPTRRPLRGRRAGQPRQIIVLIRVPTAVK